jgi:archaemetzincin
MKIAFLPIGNINSDLLERLHENLDAVFPGTQIAIADEAMPIPEETFDKIRKQYHADMILDRVFEYAAKEKALSRVLGIVDVDIFIPELSYVFGKAECPGKAALISLWRLRPEFYGRSPNVDLFLERAAKEAVHELGHTFGLGHCSNPFCVMYFSNSIFETDRKQSLFCSKCHLKIEQIMNGVGETS